MTWDNWFNEVNTVVDKNLIKDAHRACRKSSEELQVWEGPTQETEDAIGILWETIDDSHIKLEIAQNEIDGLQRGMKLLLQITKAFPISDNFSEIKQWANENLRGDFDYFNYGHGERWVMIIQDDTDRVLFKMRWGY